MNLGFQTIGLLYGTDFGDAVCKAVNCGWDTDCTGATIGALYGILYGKDALPAKWIEPLGDTVVISKEIKNIALPHNLQQLTEEVCQMGQRVLDFFQAPIEIGEEDSE